MKNKIVYLASFAIIAISFASCKKDRTCECTSTYTSTNGNTTDVSTSSTVIKKIKKSEAKKLCQKQTFTNTSNGNTNVSTDDCKLK